MNSHIEINGELLTPEIYFEPEVLIMKPVPLGVEITDFLFIKQKGYERLIFLNNILNILNWFQIKKNILFSKTKLNLKIPEIKTLDGDVVDVLSAEFVNEPSI